MTSSRPEISLGDHWVHIHRSDDALVDGVLSQLGPALASDEAVIIIATSEHREAFTAGFQGQGIDVNAAEAAGRLVWADASEIAAGLLASGAIDERRFEALVAAPVRGLVERYGAVHAYGEIVAVLWANEHIVAALQLEELWERLLAEVPASLLCGYPSSVVEASDSVGDYQALCAAHDRVHAAPPALSGADITRQFPGVPAALHDVRRFVEDTVGGWRQDDALVETATFVVNELASNAVEHAGSEFVVSLSRDGDALRVGVGDCASAARAVQPREAQLRPRGRGLQLIDALGARWGQHAAPHGKLVWAHIPADAQLGRDDGAA